MAQKESWYTNMINSKNFEMFVIVDLPILVDPIIKRNFRISC